MRINSLLSASIFSLIVAIAMVTAPFGQAIAAEPVRVTTSFDHRQCAPVLRQVAKLLSSGFDRSAADKLAADIEAMPADHRQSWDYQVSFQGSTHALHVQALIDDLGMIDLDFSADAPLAAAIRSAVDSYLNSRG